MGRTSGPYREEFSVGSWVRIADTPTLEAFMTSWSFHSPLQSPQLEYAGRVALVQSVGFQHGGDELYSLTGVPGLWHEACLSRVAS